MPPSTSSRGRALSRLRAERMGRLALLCSVLIVGLVFLYMVRDFFAPVILAAVFAGMFYPMHRWFLRQTRGRHGLSALASCLVLLLGLFLPTYGVVNLVTKEAVRLYQTVTAKPNWLPDLKTKVQGNWLMQKLPVERSQAALTEVARRAAGFLVVAVNRASRETFGLISTLFIGFFTMFYFFRDGPLLLKRLKFISPLPEHHEEALIRRFACASRATVKGTLLVALIKGTLGGLTLWAFGIQAPALWGLVMVFLSILPVVGAWLVLYPAAGLLMLNGHVWQGVALFLIAALVIGSVDNVLGPFLMGHEAGMHELLVFFSLIGGIGMFGVTGFIIGPVIGALFLAFVEIYGIEFDKQLALLHRKQKEDTAKTFEI